VRSVTWGGESSGILQQNSGLAACNAQISYWRAVPAYKHAEGGGGVRKGQQPCRFWRCRKRYNAQCAQNSFAQSTENSFAHTLRSLAVSKWSSK